jgi:uracil-DNA glycosylase
MPPPTATKRDHEEDGGGTEVVDTNKKQVKLSAIFKPKPKSDAGGIVDKPVVKSQPDETTSTSVNRSTEVTIQSLIDLADAHSSWLALFKTELEKPHMKALERFLQSEMRSSKVFPPPPRIFAWAALTPFTEIRVVILGQDPYHDDGQAMGLCFSVPEGIRVPPSLVNIYKELEADIDGFRRPKHGMLEGWARQGVLLLNTALTVRAHQAASHSGKGWEAFTDAIIRAISSELDGVVFILWGAHAHKREPMVDGKKHIVLKSVHPSPLSASRGFFGCKHFSSANAYLASKGKPTIDWHLQ